MTSQIFKSAVPSYKLFSLLESVALKSDKKYVFNKNAYKKGLMEDKLLHFFEECKPHYYASKQKYLEKKMTYNSFSTVLRQICNYNKIVYTSQIKYYKSDYDIEYHIYVRNEHLTASNA
jgi:hypothetical protein